MCGICGVASPAREAPIDRDALRRMAGCLRHRGPDGAGEHVGAGVGLAVRRLAIVDPTGGDQPIRNETGEIALVCNGEIYNAPELRRELEARGHRFQGGSDVEVIVHLYEELGAACLDRLRGMFAFALWDDRDGSLLLARDRLGIKPLCYALRPDGVLAFGSEAKAVLMADGFERRLDPAALADVLDFGGPLFDRTLLTEVRQLEPGCRIVYREGRVDLRRYWDLSFDDAGEDPRRRASAWVRAVGEKLQECVRMHLRSDVDVACWLSPGIDSSSVASLAASESQGPLATFSIGFEDAGFDELGRHPTLDRFPGSSLAGRTVRYPPATSALPGAVWHQEQPVALQLASFALAEASARDFKVVLTGQGADEALGGYAWYRRDRLLAPLRRALGHPGAMGTRHFAGLLGGGLRDLVVPLLSPELARRVARGKVGARGFAPPASFARWTRFQQLAYLETRTRLPSFINLGLDRVSMAHSLEARVPFLDHELFELCARVPTRLKLRGLREKHVLREAMRSRLPAEIVRRRKRGLQAPVPDVLHGDLAPLAEDLLSERALRDKGYFDPASVRALVESSAPNDAGRRSALAAILGLQLWDELFVRGCRVGQEHPAHDVGAPSR